MASADKLPSGKWRLRFSTGVKDSKGRYIYKTFTGNTKKEVEKKAAEYQLGKHNPNSDTIGNALYKYIEMRKPVLSPSTIRGYQVIYRMLKKNYAYIFTCKCDNLSSDLLQHFINELQRGHSSKTIANYHGLLASVMIYQNITIPNVALPQKEKPNIIIPTSEHIKLILKEAKGTELEIPIMLAAFGPLRRGEIYALKMDDINGNVIHVQRAAVEDSDGNIVIKPPKTVAGDRYLRFSDKVIDLINEKGYITTLPLYQLTKQFERLVKKLGLPKYHFHSLRHYCASRLSAMNIPESEILRRGGWETAEVMKRIYRHAMEEVSVKADEKINKAFDELI